MRIQFLTQCIFLNLQKYSYFWSILKYLTFRRMFLPSSVRKVDLDIFHLAQFKLWRIPFSSFARFTEHSTSLKHTGLNKIYWLRIISWINAYYLLDSIRIVSWLFSISCQAETKSRRLGLVIFTLSCGKVISCHHIAFQTDVTELLNNSWCNQMWFFSTGISVWIPELQLLVPDIV